MKAVCPRCGHEFDAKRRPLGAGTLIDPNSPLSFTESQVYSSLDGQNLDVRGWQAFLANRGIKKNYHQLQAALSTLTGRGMVKMNVEGFPPRYAKA